MKLSIIIPAYNEKKTIKYLMEKISLIDIPKEIIIVDDYSSDGTREILAEIESDEVKVFYHERNMGKGAAVRTAVKHVTGDIVIIQDAHLLNQTAANALLKTLEEPSATVSFILLSHRHNLLPATVLSRCLILSFVSLSGPTIVQILARQEIASGVAEAELEEAAAWSGGSMERALFFLDEENLRWGQNFVTHLSALPGNSLRTALDLAEEAAQSDALETLFFVLRSFLHDTLLYAQGLENQTSAFSGWRELVPSFAKIGILPILAMRQELLEIERGQVVNVNLKLAFEAFFTSIVIRGF